MKINHFHAHLRGLALKTFKNIQRTPTTTLEDILKVFHRKYVKPESSASAKHRFHRLTFDPENQKLPDFLEDLQESAEKAFGDNAHHMIENLLYAKMPPHLKNPSTKPIWKMALMTKLSNILKERWNLMVWRPTKPSLKLR